MPGIFQRAAAMQPCRGAVEFCQFVGLNRSAAANIICQSNSVWRSSVAVVAAGILSALVGAGEARAQMALPGSFDVSDAGAATYTIPIAVPPGTAGMQPSLSLAYNSQGGNGLLGMGWSLSGVAAITRCPRTLVQDGVMGEIGHNSNDRFCLEGQRLIAISGAYGADGTEYRTERESFSKIISYGVAGSGPSWFKAWSKSGQIMEFGNTNDSRIEAQGKTTARLWSVNKIQDTKGNYITVTYAEDNTNAQYYPIRIDYTGNSAAGTTPFASVRLSYVGRSDNFPAFESGSQIRLPDLVAYIRTYVGETLVREYRFSYSESPTTGRNRLNSVSLCDPNNNCLPATQFTWQNPPAGAGLELSQTLSTPFGNADEGYSGLRWFVADLNGDGRSDLLIRSQDGQFYVYLGTADGFQNAGVLPTGVGDAAVTAGPRYFVMDLNGDGQSDLVTRLGSTFNFYPTVGSPFSWTGNFAGNFGDVDESSTGQRYFMLDVNGDGKMDMLYRHPSGNIETYLSNGSVFTLAGTTSTPFGDANEINSGKRWFVTDVNGDGKMDLLIRTQDGQFYIYVSNGSTFDYAGVLPTAFGDKPASAGPRYFLMDVNGDGRADLVIREGGVFNFYVTNGNPFSWTGNYTTGFGDADEAAVGRRWFVMDVNGDGKQDMVIRNGSGVFNIYLSNGVTFYWAGSVATTFGDANEGYSGTRWFIMDVNGDGKQDMVIRTQDGQLHTYRSTGTTFVLDSVTATGLGDLSASNGQRWFEMDITGDGRTDIAIRNGQQIQTFRAPGPFPDLLTSIAGGLGATTTITYKPISEGGTIYAKDTGAAFPVVDFQGPLFVVSNVATSDGVGGTYQSSYAYNFARIHMQGRGFLGFERVIARDDQTEIEQVTTYRQDYPYAGLPASSTKRLRHLSTPTVWQTLNETVNTYAQAALGGTRSFVYLTQSVEKSWELNGSLVSQVTTTHQYDAYGNATEVAVATPDGYSKTTTNTYTNDALNWLLGRLTRASVTSVTP